MKKIWTILIICLLLGCGRESTIKNAVKATSTASAYGDGEYTIVPLVVPLGDKELGEFNSSVSKIGFIAGGFAKMFMNIGASLGAGKMRLSLTQKLPEIPDEYLKSIRIKRVFFYIEPTKDSLRKVPWYERFFTGRSDVNFQFVDRLGVRIATREIENDKNWEPIFETVLLDKIEFAPLEKILEQKSLNLTSESTDYGKELSILRYDNENPSKHLYTENLPRMFIINSSNPAKVRKFLNQKEEFKNLIKSSHIMNDSLFVEIKNIKNYENQFEDLLVKHHISLKENGFNFLELCQMETCLDFKVTDLNLMELLEDSRGLQLDAYIDAYKYPDSFKLKGFVEFELKLKLSF